MNHDDGSGSPVAAWGTLEEVVADAMLQAEPWTIITIEDEHGETRSYLVSHWLEA